MRRLSAVEKAVLAAILIAAIVLVGVEVYSPGGVGSSGSQLTLIPLTFQIAGSSSGYITIAVVQGQGEICILDTTLGQQTPTCTGSSLNFNTNVNDQVTFTFNPASGYTFDHYDAGGVVTGTQNPVSAVITTQPNGTFGYVDAYFDQTSTSSSAVPAQAGLPEWFWIIVILLGLIVIVRLLRR